MKDRLKFRVWCGKNDFCEEREKKYLDGWLLNENGEILATNSGDDFADGTVLEFCTGLKDKNGKLIYEGDVVIDFFSDEYFRVVYIEDKAMFGYENEDGTFTDFHYHNGNFVIVGNTHEKEGR